MNSFAQKAELVVQTGHSDNVRSIAFSPDGKLLASGSNDETVKIWNAETGRQLKVFRMNTFVNTVVFSPDGEILASSGDYDGIYLWNAKSGKLIKKLTGDKGIYRDMAFSPDGKILASASKDNTIILWDVETGKESVNLNSLSGLIVAIAFSPTGNVFASSDSNKKINIWSLEKGEKIQTIDNKEKIVRQLRFSADGKLLASLGWNSNNIKIWNAEAGMLLHTFTEQTDELDSMDFSPDGKTLVSSAYSEQISPWNIETGKKIRTIDADSAYLGVTFAKDGKRIVSASEHGTIIIWSAANGKQLQILKYDDPKNEKILNSIAPNFYHGNQVEPFSPDGKFQLKKEETSGEFRLYSAKPEKFLASLISVGDSDWAVVMPEGLFDASAGARKQMHYAVGLETVSLEQLKDVYYVPGLLKKIIDGEPLPQVELFSAENLFPLAVYKVPTNGEKEFPVKLKNRGGGIGQVQVLINGKEFLSDARPDGFDSNLKTATLIINLENAPLIEGAKNKIEIITRNAEGSISSRGTANSKEIVKNENTNSSASPNIYIIVGGISNYTGDNLDLKFAANDAEKFAKALDIGAGNLFGADKIHLRLLTSSANQTNINFQSKNAKVSTATKADFVNAFNDFKSAQPNDIFIVYLAGHGVSLSTNQTSGDTYLYLTQEATTTDKSVLAMENSRKAMTISSDELTELIKQNKALKQVLILDTCAAGAAANSLIAQRDLPSDQIRAIERLKDRTGFFVLMGAAANKVSYEATAYGQGLLTYSLLQGMKGAKLRENQFADVSQLFSYAQDTVPEMAKYIGGIQKPLIISPDTSESFDIGKFTLQAQSKINLAAPKPLILKPVLQNKDLGYDDLELTALLRQELRNLSFTVDADTFEIPIVFVEADEMTDAIKPSGSYTVQGNNINATIRLIKNKKPFKTLTVSGKVSEKRNS